MVGELQAEHQIGPINSPVGSEARVRWAKENSLTENNGRYCKNAALKGRRTALIEETAP